jgi:hypothetical protein
MNWPALHGSGATEDDGELEAVTSTQPVPLMTLPAGHDVQAPLVMSHA